MWGHTAFGRVEASQQGDPHVAVHVVGVDVGKERCAGEPGVVDEDVNATPGLQSAGHHRLQRWTGSAMSPLLAMASPPASRMRWAACLGDVGIDALFGQPQGAVAEVVKHDLGAPFGQIGGVGETQADFVSRASD